MTCEPIPLDFKLVRRFGCIPKRTKRKPPKLQKSWEGHYIIVTRLNDVVYTGSRRIPRPHRLTPYQEPHPNEGVT
ncbi:hypothetical protein NQ315_012456 [Exocentrus adspersus]|uniref:Uncharacterized protein n=1 Tax=Exocentrus adspersus TaxID=1586481 RepID=A0AAV8VMH2_9CUCU|nr:hypothetical protein NQ315_012456 [Exocentrus adspersus]